MNLGKIFTTVWILRMHIQAVSRVRNSLPPSISISIEKSVLWCTSYTTASMHYNLAWAEHRTPTVKATTLSLFCSVSTVLYLKDMTASEKIYEEDLWYEKYHYGFILLCQIFTQNASIFLQFDMSYAKIFWCHFQILF